MILATCLALLIACPGWLVANENDMTISPEGIEFIKSKEKLELEAYDDGTGVQTIGYGHTGRSSGTAVQPGTVITEEEAEQLLINDLAEHELRVNNRMKNYGITLNQRAYDYMVIATFNRGSAVANQAFYKAAANQDYEKLKKLMIGSISKSDKNVRAGLTTRVNDELEYLQTDTTTTTTTTPPTTLPPTTTSTTVPSVNNQGQSFVYFRKSDKKVDQDKLDLFLENLFNLGVQFQEAIDNALGVVEGEPVPKYGYLGEKLKMKLDKWNK